MQKWKKKEKLDVKDFIGRPQVGSGNQWYAPGDVKTDIFLIDSKYTKNKSYSLTLKTWDKLYEEALFAKRLPLLSLQIQNIELVVLDKKDFLKLINTNE